MSAGAPALPFRSLSRKVLPEFLVTLVQQRALILQLAERELLQRTRGAFLGLAWWLLSPLLLLAAYAFAFAYVIGVRWGEDPGSGPGGVSGFIVRLFAGLIVHQFAAEVIGASSGLIAGNEQYVKRIVFPVVVLPGVTLTVAAAGWGFSYIALLIMVLLTHGLPAWTALLAPAIMLPAVFTTLGIAWIVSAIGVFVRDTRNIVALGILAMMFLSPVFYPVERLETFFPAVQYVHPYATVMEQLRACLFQPSAVGSLAWFVVLAESIVIAWLGHRVFRMLQPAFADVL